MSVRMFRRGDRDQLTDLVNGHAAAVVPGVSASVNTVVTSMERRPEEFVTDPWVGERVTLVAEEYGRIAAAAHLLCYRTDREVGEELRGTGAVEWFLFRPGAEEPAGTLMTACLAHLERRRVRARYAGGELPVPGVCGVPDQWPHIRAAYERAGFRHTGHVEIVLLARVADLPAPSGVHPEEIRRTVGGIGTLLTAHRDGDPVGHLELDTTLDRPERRSRAGGIADICDLDATDDTVLDRLLGHGRDWLEQCGADRLLAYTTPDEADETERLLRRGFRELTRTARGWEHRPA
ncbi:GNAT family N-acetyltransferase [Streptomyces pactum]|nr:N-acetyltransferase [Streptomyces pactum]